VIRGGFYLSPQDLEQNSPCGLVIGQKEKWVKLGETHGCKGQAYEQTFFLMHWEHVRFFDLKSSNT
jgi:hypothetical protein